MPFKMTRELAFRAGWDEANRSMYAAGRTVWDENDYNAAWATFNLLWPLCPHKIDLDDWCRYCDDDGATRKETRSSQQSVF